MQVLANLVAAAEVIDVNADAEPMVHIGLDGILRVFSLQRIRRNDFCRLFLRLGILPSVTVSNAPNCHCFVWHA